jgi:protein O-mannosyl-transferase
VKSSGHDRRVWLVCLILVLGVFAVYGPVLRHGFTNIDDGLYVADNAHIQNGLTWDGFIWAFSTGHSSNWHPLTWLSHMLDCQLYGPKPAGHHLTNLLFHTLNSLLLFLVLRRMTGALWRSALVAALFAWHPLHVESVAWISERKDVLSTFFGLLTLLAWVRYTEKPSKTGYVLTLLLYALGLMSKPMLVTLPFLLLLLDYWPLNRIYDANGDRKRGSIAGLFWEKLPFFVLALASCVVTYLVQRHGGSVMSMENLPLGHRLANALLACVGYLRKMVWPSDLAIFYPLPVSLSAVRVLAAAALLALISAVAVVWRKRRPWLLVGWLWFLGTLVPVLGFVQVGNQSMADRYTYLPLVGVFIMLVWGLAEIFGSEPLRRPGLGWAVAVPALFACLFTARMQVNYWKDDEALFGHALAVTTGNINARVNLGSYLNRLGRYQEARDQLLAALLIEPDSALALAALGANCSLQGDAAGAERYLELALRRQPEFGDAHFNLGNVLAAQGKFAEAAEHYAAAVRLDPDRPDVHNNYGLVLARLGRFDEAAAQFKAALVLKPNFPEAEDLLGGALFKLGRLDEARAHYAKALSLKPDFIHARIRLGVILVQLGRLDEAAAFYRDALKLAPDRPEILRDSAWFLATNPKAELRNGPEAVRLAERANQLIPQPDPAYLSSLDAAYAEAGRFDDAIKTATRVRELALAASQTDVADRAAKRLESYHAGKPWRE